MKKGSDDLEQLFDTYSGKLKDHELKLLGGVEEYLGHARDLHQEFDEHVDDILKNVVQKGVDETIDGLKNAISTGLKTVLDGAVDEVSDAIHHMVEAVAGSKRSSEEGRAELEPLFKQVDAFFQPVKVVIDAVKSVAESFGVDF
jgi:phage-related protein